VRAEEQQLPLSWSGGYVEANTAALGALDQFTRAGSLPAAALADFRAYAARQGVPIPADADTVLQRLLLESVAQARWGTEGALRVEAMRDEAVRAAITALR
jgi:hypothetical protein